MRYAKMAGALMMAMTLVSAHAQEFPGKPVRIHTTSAGGGTDVAARLVAMEMTKSLGQPVIVENRDANSSIVFVAKAPADGYNVLFNGGTAWLGELLDDDVGFKLADFAPVSLVTSTPGFLVVHPSLPVRSVKDLIALAKSKPGDLNFASGSPGTLTQLAPELFKLMAGVNMVAIPFKGGGPALNAVVAGQVQLMFATATGAVPLIQNGRLRGVAVTTVKPSALFPDLPTVASSGLPGYESEGMTGAFAPAKTPAATINRLSQEIAKATNSADVKKRFLGLGVEPVGSAPAEFGAKLKGEVERMGKVIKAAGLKGEGG